MERDVGLDLDVGLDPGGRRVFDRHAGEHVSQVDAVAQDTSSIGKFGPRVDTGLERLGGDADRDLVAVADEQADRVGEVDLALGVVRLDPVERRPELLGSEHVDRGVRLLELELRRGRVAGLDDPLEAVRRRRERACRSARASSYSMPSTVAAAPAARCASSSSRSISAVSSTASPDRTRTCSARPSSAARAARTASPVPRGTSCTATS